MCFIVNINLCIALPRCWAVLGAGQSHRHKPVNGGSRKSRKSPASGLQTPACVCTCRPLKPHLSFHPSLAPVDVTLDLETAHPELILSEDRKSVRRGGKKLLLSLFDNPKRFNTVPVVLGSQVFFSGRSYWEVQVGDKPDWGLGLCRESASRKGNILFSPNHGYWVLRLQNEGNYEALTSPISPLTLSVRPRRIGIFLDYEAGEISFYNVSDRSHIYTFTDKFSGNLRPLFFLGTWPGPHVLLAAGG
uniref:B30.2/SPRY domain-containing protein n=1 Tax=Athene cunicularia TaxID=194338 RepID=A0A663MNP3_ATHCN